MFKNVNHLYNIMFTVIQKSFLIYRVYRKSTVLLTLVLAEVFIEIP